MPVRRLGELSVRSALRPAREAVVTVGERGLRAGEMDGTAGEMGLVGSSDGPGEG